MTWGFFSIAHIVSHVLDFGIPVLMFLLKLVKKDVKCIATTLGITVTSYTAIHFMQQNCHNGDKNPHFYLQHLSAVV